ncbi:MAG: ATP-binding protein [Bacteroidota bacterium]
MEFQLFMYICLDISRPINMLYRQLSDYLREDLKYYPIIGLTGPRQSGKTTLLKHMFPDFTYVSLEDPDQRYFASNDPSQFLKKFPARVIIDEAQKVPSIFSYLQTYVDSKGQTGQYILSGSQNFHFMESITQSLAGRISIQRLFPLDIDELKHAKLLHEDWESLVLKGAYPALYSKNIPSRKYYSNYLETYIKRDVSALRNVHDTKLFEDFILLCASRTGQLLNLNNLASECGITFPTAKAWLSILETSYIIFLVHPYHENFSKRVVKSSKLYFYDTGLATFLLGIRDTNELLKPVTRGMLFENFMVSELIKRNYHKNQLRSFWFWRDSNGHEVDLLEKTASGFDIFEIKSTSTIMPDLIKGLGTFDRITNGRVRTKTLIYSGDEDQDRTHFRVRSWKSSDI